MSEPRSWSDVNETAHLTWPDQIARIRAEYADLHAATLARAERAEAFAARCNEVVDAAVAERTEELRNERDRVEMDAAIADGKIRSALPTRFVLVPPDGGDVKTLEAVKATVEALERAEALLAEAGDILDLGVELVNQDDLTDSAGWDAFDAQARAILAAIPAPAPWTPPEDRPDGYRCWVWWAFDGNEGQWYRAKWHGGDDDPHWWVFGVGFCKHEMVKHFLPEPPAPEDAP